MRKKSFQAQLIILCGKFEKYMKQADKPEEKFTSAGARAGLWNECNVTVPFGS